MKFNKKFNSYEDCISFAQDILLIENAFLSGFLENICKKDPYFAHDYLYLENNVAIFSTDSSQFGEFNTRPTFELIRCHKGGNQFYLARQKADVEICTVDDISEEMYFQLSTVHETDALNAIFIISFIQKYAKDDFFFDLDYYDELINIIKNCNV